MLRYKIVNKKHKLCGSNPPKGLHHLMAKFWKKHELGSCDGAVLAYHKKELIGFFRYYKKKKSTFLYAAGTHVLKKYRGDGVAKKLWIRALKKTKPESVDVIVASRGGAKLVASLQKKFKGKIFFYVAKSFK